MSCRFKSLLLFAFISTLAIPVWGQDLIVYPAQGQSNDQMEKDKFECYSWAKGQAGFDPMAMPTATSPPPQQEAQKGGVVRGGLRGGAVGLAAGAIAGDAGNGAAIGAVSGGLIGGMRRRDQKRSQQTAQKQWEQEQANAQRLHAGSRRLQPRIWCLSGKTWIYRQMNLFLIAG